MATISKAELETLIERKGKPDSNILSVYLDVDQSQASNLNRGYLTSLKEQLRSCEQRITDEKQRREFHADAVHAVEYVSGRGPQGRTLVLFTDISENFLWHHDFRIRMGSKVRWEEKPYIRPLVEAIDEYERYGVVLVDREKARLFTVMMGEVEEHQDVFSEEKRKHFKKTSKDTTMSQSRFQRKDDEHAQWHLKDVAEALEHVAARQKFDRLILAGPHEVTEDLIAELPKKLRALVVRSLSLPIDAPEQQVLKETMTVEEEVERESEVQMVERLITAAAKDSQGVLDLQPTLDAMRQGRILKLVYAQDLAVEGSQCTKCESLFKGNSMPCPYCGAALRPIRDIVARLADLVFDSGGQAENVRGQAADRLRSRGSIGAFLRF